ncbi:MAG: hypothetical protein NC191_06875 [Muribaculaceae bacterium]|nr:hypothetical protein [Muribaculaceae bacterium]
MLDDLLKKGTEVYVTVSQSCGLELLEVDKSHTIKSYAQTELAYNEAQREIADYDEFKNALESLFKARNINPVKAKIHLSLPTVWFGLKEGLPLLLDDSAITNIVLGELEQTYIFKRKEPMPFWFDALASTNSDSRSVFYSAVQKDAVDKIKEIITAMGATLESVECSIFADLKALDYTRIAAEQMQDGYSWNLMIINNSGFQMIGMQGKKVLEYYEEPLPIKSFEGEEIYAAIENAAQIALMSTPSNSLLIISETDLVSAEIMAGRLQFSGNTLFIEDNQFRKEPLTEMSLNILQEDQVKVSLHAIGCYTPDGTFPVAVNFISEGGGKKAVAEEVVIPIQLSEDKVFNLTPKIATFIMLALLAVFGSIVGGIYKYTESQLAKANEENAALDTKISELDSQIKALEAKNGNSGFDAIAEIEKVIKFNTSKIKVFAALGESVPRNLYLTYFMTGADAQINIQGCADTVEDIYVFFRNLKESLTDSKIRISKLDLKSGKLDSIISSTISTVDNAPYIFEITNMDNDQLQSFMNRLTGKTDNNDKKDSNSNENNNSGNNNSEPAQ